MKKIWLIGSGVMSLDYCKVLKALETDYVVVGRGEKSALEFETKTGVKVVQGGVEKFLKTKPDKADHAIVSVGVEQLADTTISLLNYGVKNILVEKPAGLNKKEISKVSETAEKNGADVLIGYNRRFYASVIKAKEIIKEEGGVQSFNFEFTEWSHVIETLVKPKEVFETWFLGNSSHVADMAFYLGGAPDKISCYHAGSLKWHPAASIFAGAGVAEGGALFSYQANWESAGRWSVEILTAKSRLIFRPLEKLQIQKKGSVAIEFFPIDDKLDTEFKPGLYLEVSNFLSDTFSEFCTIKDQADKVKLFDEISGY